MLTLGALRPNIGIALGICSDDDKIIRYVNAAEERMMMMGKWYNTIVRYNFCTVAGCIALPQELFTIDAASICKTPQFIKNEWFEFISSGPGPQDCNFQSPYSLNIHDRGDGYMTAFDLPQASYLKVYCDLPEAAGAVLQVMGNDQYLNPIKSMLSGSYIEGEQIALNNMVPQLSLNQFSSITFAQKPVTNGPVRLYAVNPANGTQSLLAIYNYNITAPTFRRYYLPGCTNNTQIPNPSMYVETLCKRRHIDVAADTDRLVIQNIPAFEEMVKYLYKREQTDASRVQESELHMQAAQMWLEKELKEFNGSTGGQINTSRIRFAQGVSKSLR